MSKTKRILSAMGYKPVGGNPDFWEKHNAHGKPYKSIYVDEHRKSWSIFNYDRDVKYHTLEDYEALGLIMEELGMINREPVDENKSYEPVMQIDYLMVEEAPEFPELAYSYFCGACRTNHLAPFDMFCSKCGALVGWEKIDEEDKDPSKYDDAWFEYTVEPGESKLLQSWNELREDKDFQGKIGEIEQKEKGD